MRTFKNIKALCDYIPNCIICSKELHYQIKGMLSAKLHDYRNGKYVSIKLSRQDNILKSKHKSYAVAIDIESNDIIDGVDIIQRIRSGTLEKTCTTCHFKIETSFIEPIKNKFSATSLTKEDIHYTLKGGKDISIHKWYNNGSSSAWSSTITINNKSLPTVTLELDKFSNLEHLNKRISTIILFH